MSDNKKINKSENNQKGPATVKTVTQESTCLETQAQEGQPETTEIKPQAKKPSRKVRPESDTVDWVTIHEKYRAGSLSVAEIGRQHGVSDMTIHAAKKRYGWKRDLKDKIDMRREAGVHSLGLDGTSAQEDLTDEEIIQRAVEDQLRVVGLHRKDIRQQREIAGNLMAALLADEKVKKLVGKGDKRRAVLVSMTLKEKTECLRNISQAAWKYIDLERKAWSIDVDGSREGSQGIEVNVIDRYELPSTARPKADGAPGGRPGSGGKVMPLKGVPDR